MHFRMSLILKYDDTNYWNNGHSLNKMSDVQNELHEGRQNVHDCTADGGPSSSSGQGTDKKPLVSPVGTGTDGKSLVSPVGPYELQSSNTSSKSVAHVITGQVCQDMIDIVGKKNKHVVRCSQCNEANFNTLDETLIRCPHCRKIGPEPVFQTQKNESTISPVATTLTSPSKHPLTSSDGKNITADLSQSTQDPLHSPHIHLEPRNIPMKQVVREGCGMPSLDLHYMTSDKDLCANEELIFQQSDQHHEIMIITVSDVQNMDEVPKLQFVNADSVRVLEYEVQQEVDEEGSVTRTLSRRPEPVFQTQKDESTLSPGATTVTSPSEPPITSSDEKDITADSSQSTQDPSHSPQHQSQSPHIHLELGNIPVEQEVREGCDISTLDAHYMTSDEALQATDEYIFQQLNQHHKVMVVTISDVQDMDEVPKKQSVNADKIRNSNYGFQQEVDEEGSVTRTLSRKQEPVYPTLKKSLAFSKLDPLSVAPSSAKPRLSTLDLSHSPQYPSQNCFVNLKQREIIREQVLRKRCGMPTLDLHHMTVDEAILATEEFIFQHSDHHHDATIIIGDGAHNKDRVPKIQSEIIDRLRDSNFKFKEVKKGGSLIVTFPKPVVPVAKKIRKIPVGGAPGAAGETCKVHLKHGNVSLNRVVKEENNMLTLDLHGMTVVEAIQATEEFIFQNLDKHSIRIITGRGLHNVDKVPRIKLAIIERLRNSNYRFIEVDKGGTLVVTLIR